MKYCESKGIAFIPYFPLDAGDIATLDALRPIAAGHHATVFQVALAWLLHHSPVMLPIPGTSSVAHLDENVAAAQLTLKPEEYAALDLVAA